ncbi:MAG: hypothetical protein HOE48_06740 [Candidatus Latescibacteria bacterium]|jgi:chemotaxis protein MotA|nr:hypothetical protein [Candidatus Latescibacterota bacterium]MBT4137594.1 hypothetical protein [Candidatus Latescibacterota bacterium]MBT5832333.1 hypothetical protein [Candidatus Latescibacterota bacterium]
MAVEKIFRQSQAEGVLLMRMVVKGILSVQSGDNPRIVEQKFNTFIAPKLRQLTEEEG